MFMMSQLRNRRKTLFDKGAPKQTIESLGRIPANVKYVDSLIVFNSNILPYKRYEVRDNYVVRTAQAEAKPEIPVAPSEQLQGYNRIGY